MSGWKGAVQISVLLCCCLSAVQSQLTVTSLPAVLFSGGSQRIVEGSVVWVYCEVNSKALTVTWNKDSVPLVNDPPHIRIRNSTSDTSITFLLVVDNFQASDNGKYQCTAQNGTTTTNGIALTLTAYNSSTDGSLRIVRRVLDPNVPDNRNRYEVGDYVPLLYEIGHVGDDSTSYPTPSVMWLKDGTPFNVTSMDTLGSNNRLITALTFTFQESYAGIFQLVAIDNNSDLLLDHPLRLDTGEENLRRLTPSSIIVLRPPERLLLEVAATGYYNYLLWQRNGFLQSVQPTAPFHLSHQELPHFFEIFVREPTTADDLGVYVAITHMPIVNISRVVIFKVIGAVDASTTLNGGASVVTVDKGGSVDISCTSTGVPAPTITWRSNNQIVPFNQTDVTTPTDVTVNNNFTVDTITNGKVVSTLHIVNAQYPAHDGVYECIGDNSNGGSVSPDIANITVQVRGIATSSATSSASAPPGIANSTVQGIANSTVQVIGTVTSSALGLPESSIVWSPSVMYWTYIIYYFL